MEEKNERIRETYFYVNYYLDFYNSQNDKVKKKLNWVIDVIRTQRVLSKQYLKHLEGTSGLYEIRVQSANDIFRVFYCFDKGHLIVLFNGFQKKSQKTPRTEIERALRLMYEYYENKKK